MILSKQSVICCILISVGLFNGLKSSSQSKTVNLSCDQIDKFINPHIQRSFFHALPKGDVRLIFLDPENLLEKCKIDRWQNHTIEVINRSSGIDSLKMFDPHFVFRTRSKYMLISTWHTKKEVTLMLYHLYSNEFCTTDLKRKDRKYIISKLEGGVF